MSKSSYNRWYIRLIPPTLGVSEGGRSGVASVAKSD